MSATLGDFILTRNDPFYRQYRDELERYWYNTAPHVSVEKKRDILGSSALYAGIGGKDDQSRLSYIKVGFKNAETDWRKSYEEARKKLKEEKKKRLKEEKEKQEEKPSSSENPLTPQTVLYLLDGKVIPLDSEQEEKLREKTKAQFTKLGVTDLSKTSLATRRLIEQSVYNDLLDLEIERNTQRTKKRRKGIAKLEGDFSKIASDAAARYLISQKDSFSTSKTPYDVWIEEHFKGSGATDPFLL